MSFDTLITIGIVVAAALYLVRQFARSQKQDKGGCASGGGCCGNHRGSNSSGCCATKPH